MALTRESINGRYNAQVAALGARPSKYRRQPKYRTNPRNGIRRLIGYTREPNSKAIRRYSSRINAINRNRNAELQRLALRQSNVPQWAKAKAQRQIARNPAGYRNTSAVTLARNYARSKEAKDAYNRRSSITNARSAAVKAEERRQIALRESQQQNKINQIKATTAQNQKVKQSIESAGYDSTKLQRAGGRPSPRKESVSNPDQRKFAQQQANRTVDETVVTSKESSAAALIRATQNKKRRDSIVQQAKLNPALVGTVPMKFPEPIPYARTVPQRNPFDEFSFNDVKKPEPKKIGSPLEEYAKGQHAGYKDLYITGQNVVRYVRGKEQIPQKGNSLDNLIFAPLDAGVQSYESNTDFTKNFNERVKKVETDFWANPAYGIGSAVPSALIIGASVIVPPIGAAKYGINILPKVPKVAKAISKGAKVGVKNKNVKGMTEEVGSAVPKRKPRSLNKGKFGIGDPISYARATSKVPKIDKNRIRTSKAESYKVNPNLLIRKTGNITSKEIPKGIDLEPRTISEIFGKGVVKTAKGNAVKKIMANNKKVSDRILKLGKDAKVKQPHKNSRAALGESSGFGKVVKSGKQQLIQKNKTKQSTKQSTKQKTQPKWVQQNAAKQTGKTVKNQTQKLKDFWNTGKNGQVTKQVSKTVRKGAKTGSKSKLKSGVKPGVKVGGMLSIMAVGRKTKPKQKVRPILEPLIDNPLKKKPDSKQGTKPKQDQDQGFVTLFWDHPPTQITDPIIDDPPVEDPVFVPVYRPPTTKTTTTPKQRKRQRFAFRKYGSGFGYFGGGGGRPKKIYEAHAIRGVFEKSQVGKSVFSSQPIDDYYSATKKRGKKKSNITGMMDYDKPVKKKKKKTITKKSKKKGFWDF